VKYLPIVLVCLLAACSRRPPEPAAREEAAKAPASHVTLAPEAQKEAGIRVEATAFRSQPQVLRANARMSNDENHSWRVGAITEGRVVEVLANPGDAVSQGQVLARMHSHGIHEARAQYRSAVAGLGRARSEQALALRVRDRARRLYQLKAGSQEQLERAETELRGAETTVTNAQVEVDRTRAHLVDFLGVTVDPVDHDAPGHRDEGDYIPVRSPAAGVVLTRNVTPGTVVTPANDLFVVSDLSRLWAIVEVNEEHLAKLRVGMPVRIYVQAYTGRPFAGRIGKIGEALDPDTRTVKVRVDVPNSGGRLKPEMYATAEIELGGSESAVFVPQQAVQEVRGQNSVFVRAAPDRFEVRPVETGRSVQGEVEILRGLKSGEAVAVSGTFVLKSEFLKSALAEE